MATPNIFQVGSGTAGSGGGSAAAPGDVVGLTAEIIEYWSMEVPLASIGMARIGILGTKPSPLGTYAGIHVYAESPDGGTSRSVAGTGTADSAVAAPSFQPEDLGIYPDSADRYLAVFSLPVGTPAYTVRIYAVSYSTEAENALVPASSGSPSPNCTLLVGVPSEIVGREYADLVTGLSVTADLATIGGIVHTRIFTSFTPPADTRWTGAYVHVLYNDDNGNPADNIGIITNGTGANPSNWFPAPTVQTAKVRVLSFSDPNGTADPTDDGVNSYVSGLSPETTVSIGTNSGTVDAANSFNFNTSDFHVDPTTGKWAINNVDFSKAINFDSSNFDFNGLGDFIVKDGGIQSRHLYANGIDVGGGANMPTLFRVYNHSGSLTGFIGDDFGSSGYDGAWFKRLLVGGTSPATAPLFADSSGNVVANGIYVNSAGSPLGWIGQNGTDTGAWFKKLSIGGSSFSTGPLQADSSGNVTINGATFSLTNGTITVSIDGTNFLKVVDTSGSNTVTKINGTTIKLYGDATAAKMGVTIQLKAFGSLLTGGILMQGSNAPYSTIAEVLEIYGTVVSFASAGSATLPATPQGFIKAIYNGTDIRIPYYLS